METRPQTVLCRVTTAGFRVSQTGIGVNHKQGERLTFFGHLSTLDREEKSARKLVKRMDKERKAYYEFFTDENWLDMGQYDLCIDSSRFTTEEIVKILKEAYER